MVYKDRLPITILGGYLGAGKTTLVNHLLRYANGRRLAILVNEFGELPIDADLIEAEEDDLISLSGGCVCCSFGSDMMAALKRLGELVPRPDHVIVEASGVAIPSMVAGSISILEDYSLDGVIVLIDARTIRDQAADTYLADTISRQLKDGDIIIVNKVDLIAPDEVESLNQWLEEMSLGAPVIPAVNADVSIEIILQDWFRDEIELDESAEHALVDFRTEVLKPSEGVHAQQFGQQLISDMPALVRAKGFVKDLDGIVKTIQIVGNRLDVSLAPVGVEEGVVIIVKE